jgi:hypothetical protein
MAEPARLHDLGVHLGLRVVTVVFTALTAVAAVGLVVDHRDDLRFLGVLVVPLLVAWLWRATIWRARPLFLDDIWLVVGRGRGARRIAVAQVARIDRPGWAFPDRLFAPLQLEVRGGPPVLFFPAPGAEVLLRGRVHGG